jgi:hypothetical protein
VGKTSLAHGHLIKARQQSSRELFIIKAISKNQLTKKENLVDLVKRERAILERIDHPFLAKVFLYFYRSIYRF